MSLARVTRQFALPNWSWYLAGICALAITTWVTITIPKLSKHVINDLNKLAFSSELTNLSLMIIGLGLAQMLIRSMSRILMFWPGRKIEAEVKTYFFQRFLNLPIKFFLDHKLGDLISRISNDVGQLRVFYAFAFLQTINFFFLLCFAIAQMLSVNSALTCAALTPLILMLITTRIGMPLMHKYSMASQSTLAQLTNKVTESFVNIPVIQASHAIEAFVNGIEQSNYEVYKSNLKLALIRIAIFPLTNFLTGLSYLIVLFYGGKLIIEHKLTVGDLLAFNIYISLLSFPLTALGLIMAIYNRAKTAAQRLFELDQEPVENQALLPIVSSASSCDSPLLEVKNLNFSYPTDEKEPTRLILQNVSFTLHNGQMLGILGPIGSGKTTLLNVIATLFQSQKGHIFFMGEDICNFSPKEIRKHMGYALQTPFLFSASIEENISFGQVCSKQDLEKAADFAQILSDIKSQPNSWETQIGEKGVRLSGGQKQRLALARIFVKNPQLWLLDDVTSAVDQSTEQNLINALKSQKSGMIIVSHRPETLKKCDYILVIKNGKIIDRGSFQAIQKNFPNLLSSD